MGLFPLVCVTYLVISGGAYGLEDAVRMAGPRLTLLLCLLVPLTLSLPTALMAAELTALMPVEGGFYFWVKEALGPFAGFAEAYLTILYTAVDMAIYPVLFAGYLSFIIPLGPAAQIAIGIALVWAAGALNFLGVRPVGMASIALSAILISPFAALVIAGFPHLLHFTMPTQPLFGADPWSAMAGGLTVVIWNFGGWENLSVVSAEIENPRRNYLRAVLIALPIIVAGYVLPLAVSVSGTAGGADWGVGSFSHEGYRIGGPILGSALAIGGAVMSFAVFEAAMLWVSRMPFVLARERYLPRPLTEIWSTTATPGPIDSALLHRLHAAGAGRVRGAGGARRVLLYGSAHTRDGRPDPLASNDAQSRRDVHRRRRPHRPRNYRHPAGPDLDLNLRPRGIDQRRQTGFHPGNRLGRMRVAGIRDLPKPLRRPARARSSAHIHHRLKL